MSILVHNLNPLLRAIDKPGVRQATMYLSPKEIVRATKRTFRGKIPRRGNVEVILTFGKPNYREREFIKACVKAGEPFSVKKVQVRMEKGAR